VGGLPEQRRHRHDGGDREPASGPPGSSEARTRLDVLTDRERDVVALLGEGRSNAEIAGTLYLTEATVKGYVSRAPEKSGCTNRTQLGLLAREARLRR
jgi:DNA-binding NarL/FixJ family response regulator